MPVRAFARACGGKVARKVQSRLKADEGIVMTTRGRSTYRMTPSRWVVMFLVIMLVSSAAIALVGALLTPN